MNILFECIKVPTPWTPGSDGARHQTVFGLQVIVDEGVPRGEIWICDELGAVACIKNGAMTIRESGERDARRPRLHGEAPDQRTFTLRRDTRRRHPDGRLYGAGPLGNGNVPVRFEGGPFDATTWGIDGNVTGIRLRGVVPNGEYTIDDGVAVWTLDTERE